jgi:hypothetical protein
MVCVKDDDAADIVIVEDAPIEKLGTDKVDALGIVVSVSDPFSPDGTFTVPGRYVCVVGVDMVA